MDKTNKITITCSNWETRVAVSQAVADLLGINMLDVDDYIIRGSVMNGDLDEYSKEDFIRKYGKSLFATLETISYMAYVDTVKEPFVIAMDCSLNDGNADIFKKTISVSVGEDNGIYSLISDYSVARKKTISKTAKEIVRIVTNDDRWEKDLQ